MTQRSTKQKESSNYQIDQQIDSSRPATGSKTHVHYSRKASEVSSAKKSVDKPIHPGS